MRNRIAVIVLLLLMVMSIGVYAVASVSATCTEVLNPDTLDGAHIYLELIDDTFVDSTISVTLNNAPTGVTVGSVYYIDSTQVKVVLAYDDTPIGASVSNFSVTVPMSELTGGVALTSNDLDIHSSPLVGGLSEIGDLVAKLIHPTDGWIHLVFAFFLSQTLLVILLGLMIFGAAISFVMRLIHRR